MYQVPCKSHNLKHAFIYAPHPKIQNTGFISSKQSLLGPPGSQQQGDGSLNINAEGPAVVLSSEDMEVSGVLSTKGSVGVLPRGSCISLTLVDASVMDVKAFVVASHTFNMSQVQLARGIRFVEDHPLLILCSSFHTLCQPSYSHFSRHQFFLFFAPS